MDVNVSSHVAKMKRDLMKLIGIGEFSDVAVWKDPCTSFVIPEVFAYSLDLGFSKNVVIFV